MSHAGALALEEPTPRWPGVVGTIGIVVAVLTLVDKASDLLMLLVWSEADWYRVLAPEVARLVVRLMPSTAWLVTTTLVWIVLSFVLLRGSIRVRRRERSGVPLCQLWSRLAIAWFALEMVLGLGWLTASADEISAVAPPGWQAPAVLGILLALVLMLAYPVFLLVWFSREEIRQEYDGWHR